VSEEGRGLTGGVRRSIAANPQNNDRLTDWDKGTLLKNAARSDGEGGRREGGGRGGGTDRSGSG
jgi:hypothetical protein